MSLAERWMSEALHLGNTFNQDPAVTFFYIGIIRQKYRELQPIISNVVGFDTCVMVSSLEKFVAIVEKNDERVEKVWVGLME